MARKPGACPPTTPQAGSAQLPARKRHPNGNLKLPEHGLVIGIAAEDLKGML